MSAEGFRKTERSTRQSESMDFMTRKHFLVGQNGGFWITFQKKYSPLFTSPNYAINKRRTPQCSLLGTGYSEAPQVFAANAAKSLSAERGHKLNSLAIVLVPGIAKINCGGVASLWQLECDRASRPAAVNFWEVWHQTNVCESVNINAILWTPNFWKFSMVAESIGGLHRVFGGVFWVHWGGPLGYLTVGGPRIYHFS